MTQGEWRIYAHQTMWDDSIQIALFFRPRNGRKSIAKPLTLEEIEESAAPIEPTMRLPTEVAQQLMDQLWNCGLRPREGSGSSGSLAATEKHLADMQKIAFGMLKNYGMKD